LLPRLPQFYAAHPFVDLRLLTNNNRVDLAGEGLDCAIRFGDGAWLGTDAWKLVDAPLSPFSAPVVARRMRHPVDLAAETLLRSYRADEWTHWIAAANARTGEVNQVAYCLPEPRQSASTGSVETEKPAPKARPDITAKGMAMIGDLRTDALHHALGEASIGDDVLMGLLVLGLGGCNVQVHSGAASKGYGWRERIAETLTEGGVLTQDLAVLRTAAREMLVEVLSCRVNMSQSGMGARHADAAIGADLYLPNMATPEFLSCLSKQAMQRTASANGVAPRNTGKETRAAVIAQVGTGSFVHPAALFPPTAKELEARRHPASLIANGGDGPEDVVSGKDKNDAGNDDAVNGKGTDCIAFEDDEPGENEVSTAGTDASRHHNAA